MLLKRFSVLASMLLAACVPSQWVGSRTSGAPNCYDYSPTKSELAAWRAAIRQNTSNAYKSFIRQYPRSCYVPLATARISTAIEKRPVTIRNVPKTVAAEPRSRGAY